MSLADELAKLKELHEAGHLTADEYAAAKRKLLAEEPLELDECESAPNPVVLPPSPWDEVGRDAPDLVPVRKHRHRRNTGMIHILLWLLILVRCVGCVAAAESRLVSLISLVLTVPLLVCAVESFYRPASSARVAARILILEGVLGSLGLLAVTYGDFATLRELHESASARGSKSDSGMLEERYQSERAYASEKLFTSLFLLWLFRGIWILFLLAYARDLRWRDKHRAMPYA
ncbi:MAG: SHOCT domain-containing protein [Planctomycetes bacterium]|nr:SHOCT domain-containing protein [Planctomycetota bacterium]